MLTNNSNNISTSSKFPRDKSVQPQGFLQQLNATPCDVAVFDKMNDNDEELVVAANCALLMQCSRGGTRGTPLPQIFFGGRRSSK